MTAAEIDRLAEAVLHSLRKTWAAVHGSSVPSA
jgi:hypothetical protein